MTTDLEVLAQARFYIQQKTPYFVSGVQSLIPYPLPGLKTFGVTKSLIMAYDPETAVEWGFKKVGGVMLHEYQHSFMRHHDRFAHLSPEMAKIANVAMDLAINPAILSMGFELPDGVMLPKAFGFQESLSAEEYYALLLDKMEKEGWKPKEGGNPGSGECGSVAGNAGSWEGELPQDIKAAGRGEADVARIHSGTANDLAKGTGNCPAAWRKLAEDMLAPPKVRWQTLLMKASQKSLRYVAGKVDLHYGQMSRRQWGCGLGSGRPVMPSYRAPKPNIGFIVDSSGSMSNDDVMRGLSEAMEIVKQVGGSVKFLVTDCQAEAADVKEINSLSQVKSMFTGGGGTDFRPAFEAMSKLKDRPNLIVFATDGFGPAPERKPPWCEVIWLICQPGGVQPAPWGTGIDITQ